MVKVHSSTIWKPYSIEIGKGYLYGKHLQKNKTIGKSQVWVKVRRMEPISQEKIKNISPNKIIEDNAENNNKENEKEQTFC